MVATCAYEFLVLTRAGRASSFHDHRATAETHEASHVAPTAVHPHLDESSLWRRLLLNVLPQA